MTYDLALKLKNAGFPQIGKGRKMHDWGMIEGPCDEPVYEPTLSELIEAFGKEFGSLERIHIGWRAKDYKALYNKNEISEQLIALAPEADEAVAYLWLGLNKK